MQKGIIYYKTRPNFSYFIVVLLAANLVSFIENIINGDTIIKAGIDMYTNNNWKIIFGICGCVFVLMSLFMAVFTITSDEFIIKYPLRPIFRNFSYKLSDIDKIIIDPFVGPKVNPKIKVVLLNSPNKKIIFSHISKKKDINELAEHFRELHVKVEIL